MSTQLRACKNPTNLGRGWQRVDARRRANFLGGETKTKRNPTLGGDQNKEIKKRTARERKTRSDARQHQTQERNLGRVERLPRKEKQKNSKLVTRGKKSGVGG